MKNQQHKLRHLSELEENLKKYDYPVNIITNGIKKSLKISQNELMKSKEKETDEVWPFIFTFNPNNPPGFELSFWNTVRKIYPFAALYRVNKNVNMKPTKFPQSLRQYISYNYWKQVYCLKLVSQAQSAFTCSNAAMLIVE